MARIAGSTSLYIGRQQEWFGKGWEHGSLVGLLDEVRYSNYPRTQSEVRADMHSKIDSAPGLISSRHFEDDFVDAASGYDGAPQGTATFDDGPLLAFDLTVVNLSPGQLATITATGAEPGSRVIPIYSLTGAGPTVTQYGFSLDLTWPLKRLSSLVADSFGVATLDVTVPPNAPIGLPVWFQAVEVRSGPIFRVSIPVAAVVQ